MADKKFVDVGDELIVRIAGYPVGKARVWKMDDQGVHFDITGLNWTLPLSFKNWDVVDGVAHELSPPTAED